MPNPETLYSKGFQDFNPNKIFQIMEKRSDFSLFFGKKPLKQQTALKNYLEIE